VLGADVLVAHQPGLLDGELDDAFGARRQRGFAIGRPVTLANGSLDGLDHLHGLDTQLAQDLDGDALILFDQA
jgi:hypothetical protein